MFGTIKMLQAERGFGFVTGEDGKERFFHRTDVLGRFGDLDDGDRVQFEEVIPTPEKGPRAKNVAPVERQAA